jgi:tetratricopeptide (TPR) repeat protein
MSLLGVLVVGLILISFLPPSATEELPPPARPVGCASTADKEAIKQIDTTRQMAPLLEGLGTYTMPVTSDSEEAKRFFNQGLNLYYGFNHLEAFRSFKEAARLDPDFAMAYWGQALSLGPNINLAMDPADAGVVYEAVVKAQERAESVTVKEKLLIKAVASRYTKEAPADRTPLDKAYAETMKKVTLQFPADADVVSLYAEALMDLHPWDYWLKEGTAQPWTAEILTTIEKVLTMNPQHPGANHFYIHAYEASATPGKATASADLLRDLLPGAGHLVHMPSHIYIRTGRYEDGVTANLKAVQTDELYLKQCKAEGFYPLVLYPHNIHFLWACATLDGQSKEAIKAADLLAAKQSEELLLQPAWTSLQHFSATPYYARVRFGKWDEILRLERPDERLKYSTGIWRYARAIAFVRKDKHEQAIAELEELKKMVKDPVIAEEKILGINPMVSVLLISQKVVEGELASAKKDYAKATDALKEAVKIEDGLLYQEPYDWHHPVRQVLGDVLLESGDAAQAEKYFREDLQLFAGNGWSLTGLKLALEKQGKAKEARQVELERKKSFARADVQLTRARF